MKGFVKNSLATKTLLKYKNQAITIFIKGLISKTLRICFFFN